MKRAFKYYRIIWLKHDLPAGLAVFLVALPLCLGIALASGAPLYAGLLSGIIGGLVVSLISGSSLAVSGPAAGLTSIVAASILSLGDYKTFLLAVMIAGLFQVLLGLLRLGILANYFPSSVIKGMLAAIGIILISKQIPLALGYDSPDFWTSGFLRAFSSESLPGGFKELNKKFTRGTVLISLLSLAILILMQQRFAKKLKVIPAQLVVVIAGILINAFFSRSSAALTLKPTQLVQIPADIFSHISFPDFTKLFSHAGVWKDGLVIGLLATIETLLCIEAIDKMDQRNRITPVNRELVAQGIGNMTCGMLGAIPLTAVVVRGAANIDAGGKTKLSAFTHGLFLLLAVLFFPFILNQIPYASLAAILLITGYNLAKPRLFRNMWRLGWKQFLPFLITILVILATDLLMGVCIGLLLSVYFIIQDNFRTEYKVIRMQELGMEKFHIKLHTSVTFLNKVKLRKTLDEIPEYSILVIDGSDCHFIDHDILEIISEFAAHKAHDRHIELYLKDIKKVDVFAVH